MPYQYSKKEIGVFEIPRQDCQAISRCLQTLHKKLKEMHHNGSTGAKELLDLGHDLNSYEYDARNGDRTTTNTGVGSVSDPSDI